MRINYVDSMEKKKPLAAYFIIILITILASCVLAAGCSSSSGGGGGGGGVGNISGTVDDTGFDPISDATVAVDSALAYTLSNGTYSFINIPGGQKVVRITATGYTPAYRKLTLSGGTSAVADIAFLEQLDNKSTPIGPGGGTATNTMGRIKMVFPASALPNTENIILTSVDMIAAPYNAPEAQQFISYIVYAKPETPDLSVPAVLSVPNLTNVTTEAIQFYHFNTNSLQWQPLAIGSASSAKPASFTERR